MANKFRNEVEVELNGTKYTLRPTFTCLEEIEEFIGQSIFQFRMAVLNGQLKAKHAFFVLDSAIKAGGSKVDSETLKHDMSEAGWNAVLKAVCDFIGAGIFAGDLAKKN